MQTAQIETAQTQFLPIDLIEVAEDFNPRKIFHDEEFNRLVSSIRENGLISPIAVRPRPDGRYWLIAGERRLRALRLLKETDVPALVRECDDVEARRLALLENLDRSQLTVSDEALSAKQHLDAYEGDHAAAAAALGWPVDRLKHRLRLLHCSAAVLDALGRHTIKIGHAELLAGLPAEAQDKLLGAIIEKGVSVQDFKVQLEGFALPLSQAIFDTTTDCVGCPSNSTSQADLFSTTISGAKCSNKGCFQSKTTEALEARQAKLKDEYATVAFATQVPEGRTIPLTMYGATGLPEKVLSACQGCAFRGVVIEDRIGSSTGKTSGPTCFQRTCHSEKLAAVKAEADQASTDATPDRTTACGTSAGETTATAPTSPRNGTKPPAPKADAPRAVPRQVLIACDAMQRAAVSNAVGKTPTMVLALAVYGLHRLRQSEAHGKASDLDFAALGLPQLASYRSDETATIAELSVTDPQVLRAALVSLSQAFVTDGSGSEPLPGGRVNRRKLAAKLRAAHSINPAPFVVVDKAFLATFTKAGIEQVLDESGFAAWMKAKDDGEKAYRALLAKGKDDLVSGVLAAGFDFTGYVPSAFGSLD
jgi:ParB family chromosome partitioning protein